MCNECLVCDYCEEQKEDVEENVINPYLEAISSRDHDHDFDEDDLCVTICEECYAEQVLRS